MKKSPDDTHTILVYGTLRKFDNIDVVKVSGYLYDLGWYPGICLANGEKTDSRVVCERITVSSQRLEQLDRYEGYNPNDRDNSLYIRERIGDDWIYVYNRSFRGRPLIESGDWEEHTKQQEEV